MKDDWEDNIKDTHEYIYGEKPSDIEILQQAVNNCKPTEESQDHEIWKPVPNYNGRYEASNHGRNWALQIVQTKPKNQHSDTYSTRSERDERY